MVMTSISVDNPTNKVEKVCGITMPCRPLPAEAPSDPLLRGLLHSAVLTGHPEVSSHEPPRSMSLPFITTLRASRVLHKSIAALAVAGVTPLFTPGISQAQESGALIDALVRKGVLSSQEGADIRSELAEKSGAESSASKIRLTESIKELKLYGDIRLRYQYDSKDYQADPFPVGARGTGFDDDRSPSGSQRSRWRFRLRLNADFKLTENVFGGVELQTGIASDSANETFQDGFRDYPIFISKAYLGWSPTEWLTFTAGKVPNPFYTTELVWDADINPTGITQQIAFHKLFNGGEETNGYSKDGKTVVTKKAESPWELTLIAGQFIFDDNFEGGGRDPGVLDNDETTDAYLFHTQLVGSYRFNKELKVTLAPGWLVYNAGSASGLENNNPFQDRVDADGNRIVSGATRNLNLLLLPGDLAFKVAGIKTKLFWDFSYNLEGRKRTEDIYNLVSVAPRGPGEAPDPDDLIKNHSNEDDYAFLIGVQLGENKKRRDWSVFANYRRTGLAAVDPNLNDSDFAEAELNTQGFKLGIAYNLTDYAVFGVTYQYAWQIRDIQGGEATGGNAIADSNDIQTIQVDLNVKF